MKNNSFVALLLFCILMLVLTVSGVLGLSKHSFDPEPNLVQLRKNIKDINQGEF